MCDGLEQEYVQRAWSLIATSRESAFRIPEIYKVLSETRLVFYRLLNIFPTAKVVLLPPLTPLSETAWNERFRTFPRVYSTTLGLTIGIVLLILIPTETDIQGKT